MCKTIVIEFMEDVSESLVEDTLEEIYSNLMSQDVYCLSIKDIHSEEDRHAS